MFHRSWYVVGVFVCAALVVHTSPAFALCWLAPMDERTVVTAYGAVYEGHTHRGVDLAGSTGDVVSAPVSGMVSFAGSVPADGGGTCNAVTIELPSGDKVSLLPLSEVWVREGDRLNAGDQVGSLAGSGDSSSSVTHLHLSLRHDGAYEDPTSFLPGNQLESVAPEAPLAVSGGLEEPETHVLSAEPMPQIEPAQADGASPLSSPVSAAHPAAAAPVKLSESVHDGVSVLINQEVKVSSSGKEACTLAESSWSPQLIQDAGVPESSALRVFYTADQDHGTSFVSALWREAPDVAQTGTVMASVLCVAGIFAVAVLCGRRAGIEV